jgi:hypothetical protein
MGIERNSAEASEPASVEPQSGAEEHLRRGPGLDHRIHGPDEDDGGVVSDESEDSDNKSQWESDGGSMARQVPEVISEESFGG